MQFEIREEEHRLAEIRDWQENREEREREEMEQMRRAEKAAAEKQISRTAEREAREDVEVELQEFRTQARIKLMVATYRARNIRQFGWTLAFGTLISMIISMKIIEDNRTTAFSQELFLVGLIGSIVVVCSFGIGWKWGEARLEEKTEEEIEDMVHSRKQDKLVEFHERDRIVRLEIARQDEIDRLEKEARIRARKAEKKRLRKIDRRRKKETERKTLELNKKRSMLFAGKGGGEGKDDPVGASSMSPAGLISIATSAALAAVESVGVEEGGSKVAEGPVADSEAEVGYDSSRVGKVDDCGTGNDNDELRDGDKARQDADESSMERGERAPASAPAPAVAREEEKKIEVEELLVESSSVGLDSSPILRSSPPLSSVPLSRSAVGGGGSTSVAPSSSPPQLGPPSRSIIGHARVAPREDDKGRKAMFRRESQGMVTVMKPLNLKP